MADNINQSITDLGDVAARLLDRLEACCANNTPEQVIDPPPIETPPNIGPAERWETAEEYSDAKCSAANAIYDTLKGQMDWLDNNHVDVLLGGFGAITTGLSFGLATTGPVGWAALAAGALITTIAGLLFAYAFDFGQISDALDEVHDDIVSGLHASGGVTEARASILSNLATTTLPPSGIESDLISLMASNVALNQLFEPRADVSEYVSPDPVVCSLGSPTINLIGTSAPAANLTGTPVVLSSVVFEGINRIRFTVTPPAGGACENYNLSVTAHTSDGGYPDGLIEDCDGTALWRYNIHGYGAFVGDYVANQLYASGSTPFTVSVTWSAIP